MFQSRPELRQWLNKCMYPYNHKLTLTLFELPGIGKQFYQLQVEYVSRPPLSGGGDPPGFADSEEMSRLILKGDIEQSIEDSCFGPLAV